MWVNVRGKSVNYWIWFASHVLTYLLLALSSLVFWAWTIEKSTRRVERRETPYVDEEGGGLTLTKWEYREEALSEKELNSKEANYARFNVVRYQATWIL